MNKTVLMNYALFARKELESQIALSLNKIGIFENSIKTSNVVGDYTIIEGIEETFPRKIYDLRKSIVAIVKDRGFKQTVEEFAYTWFNRIVAIRFMEVHDYFDHGFRVLSSRNGTYEPEILKNVSYVIDYLNLDVNIVNRLRDQSKLEELYRYILFKQCNSLSKILPMLFNEQESYIELLLPNNLLSSDSVIRHIEDIPEEDFLNDVEIIGWLYQSYNSVKKGQVFASKKIITKDTLPAITQLFTPDWIVKYMAENSVGRIWLESYPNSLLKDKMKYYVFDAKQEDEIQKKIDFIKYKDINPEDIRIIEPCCGSGHILVYLFDLLFEMYKEKGYSLKDIPSKILTNNLYGLDVDKRAAQLSEFSLLMKARSIDNRFFNESRIVFPNIYEIIDSKLLISLDYKQNIRDFGYSKRSIEIIEYLVNTFENGKVIGSLLMVENKDYQSVIDETNNIKRLYTTNLLQEDFKNYGLDIIIKLCTIAKVMSSKYDVMITNPPYCGTSNLEINVKKYFNDFYPNSKSDMFGMFMEVSYVKKNGFRAMINMHSWMFLSSYEKLRKFIIENNYIVNMVHLGAHAFESIGGEVVQTTSFVLRNSAIATNGVYYRLVDSKNKEQDFLTANSSTGGGIICSLLNYTKIPGFLIGYWLSSAVLNTFNVGKTMSLLSPVCKPTQGLATGDNNRFVREWWEVSVAKSYFSATDYIQAVYTGAKWFPYNKGGEFRKWYGNNDYVVNWEANGKEIRNLVGNNGKIASRAQNTEYYFRESITWSKISSGNIAFRYKPQGHIFDVAGTSIFTDDDIMRYYLISVLNSCVIQYVLRVMSPTLNYEVGQIASLPIIVKNGLDIENKSKDNINLSKEEWDDFEESWDFKKHPLI